MYRGTDKGARMDCPSCGHEMSERTAYCTQCGAAIQERHRTAKRFLKWGGIGCAGLLGLFIVIVIIAALMTETPSQNEQEASDRGFTSGRSSSSFDGGDDASPPSEGLETAVPDLPTWTSTEAFIAGSEFGDQLKGEGRKLNDDFVQEAVSRVASKAIGKSGGWAVANSDINAVCDVYHRTGDARARGDELTRAEFEAILRSELGLKGSALMGAIQSGISDDPEAIVDFCAPIHAYGVGFTAAFEFAAELYELDQNATDAPARLDSAIDGVPRIELRTDRQTAYHKGFLAGMGAASEIGADHDTPSSPGASELNIRYVGAADLSDQGKSSLAEVIERVQEGVVQVTAGSGSGSGFIVDEHGVVVTNEHVVRGRREVGIWLTNGRRYQGDVLALDSTADLALVQIKGNDQFHAITVGDPAGARVGDEVLALGFPLAGKIGNSLTVTRGIISSTRTVNGVKLLQTDAAINPGNSGGPLINEYGQVIGVNAFRIEETTGGRPVNSIGFAVSVVEIQRMVPSSNAQSAGTPTASSPTPTIASTPPPVTTPMPSTDTGVAVDSIVAESPYISSGIEHTCSLLQNGTPVCWGNRPFRKASPPEGEVLTSVSSGTKHICGLREDGTAVCWGWHDDRVQTPPDDRLVSISAGDSHSCGLREDGSAVCWGYVDLSGITSSVPSAPDGSLAAISSGGNHVCGLRTDGTPACWGFNANGEASPPPGEKFISISSGSSHTCALRPDGTAVCWGSRFFGQASPPGGRFTSISSGGGHTCALRSDGVPACWGGHGFGQTSPPPGETFIGIGSGNSHTCALRSDHTPVCWGSDTVGESSPP